ncbi:ABC transporter substrate-binding protein [Actinokineospora globicatena]|uniref:ABC transporter substrate-binding protein n=1 Tax=Actinokineospora globicatena TaxID=103729 RepID=UPI0020A28064|nr:ABC transporter substrate-binding protein [Actinokineospora globicatena]
MPILPRRPVLVIVLGVLGCVTLACTPDPAPPASGDPAGTSMVIGVADEPGSLDPLDGYAPLGAAKIFDGLVEHQPSGVLRPALASALPEPSADGRSWTAQLREDVSFTNGGALDAAAVTAAYRRVLEPEAALRDRFWMLDKVTVVDQRTVRFDLRQPYARFLDLLVLGIPAQASTPVKPIGTGPYQLVDWLPGQRMTLTANKAYYGGRPAVTNVTIEFIPDDQDRAKRMREGKLDGTELPPRLVQEFSKADGLNVVEQRTTDVRAVAFADQGVTADPAVRLALNLAVDRQNVVNDALAGQGVPLSLPVPPVLAEFVEPGAHIDYDLGRAKSVLDAAGWVPGSDGIRVRAGERAEFTLAYPPTDVVDGDLATAFTQAAAKVGIKVTPDSTAKSPPWMTSYGDPFTLDLALYPLLHPAGGEASSALDAARTTTDPAQRAVAFRALQRAYATTPSMVVLAVPTHSYVLRDNWTGYTPVVDSTGTDHTWGPWWNLQAWTPN